MPGRKRPRNDLEVQEAQFGAEHGRRKMIRPKQSGKRGRHGRMDAGETHNSRSAASLIEGGDNEYLGEPPEGYFTEAPGKQGGGKR